MARSVRIPEIVLDEEKKKYDRLEPLLQKMNNNSDTYVTEERRNKNVLQTLVPIIIEQMKICDPMFKAMYQNIFYGGGYFDGVKVEKPDEFDLDITLQLPKITDPRIEIDKDSRFVKVKLMNYKSFMEHKDFEKYRKMDKFVDADGFMLPAKFREWFESLMTKSATEVRKNNSNLKYEFSFKKSGPAMTLVVIIDGDKVDVDLVPSLTFTTKDWPSTPFRRNTTKKVNFLVVPKCPKGATWSNRSWRLSFQEQERELLHDKNRLKDIYKLLKLLRNQQGHHVIASYFIKTVLLWMVLKINDVNFWSKYSKSYVFMTALKFYHDILETGCIPYYWNDKDNLLDGVDGVTLVNLRNRLSRLLKSIEKHIASPADLEKVIKEFFGKELNETTNGNKVEVHEKFVSSTLLSPQTIFSKSQPPLTASSASSSSLFYQTRSLSTLSTNIETSINPRQHFCHTEDRHDAFGRMVAHRIRDLKNADQKRWAEKFINDILFEAERNNLDDGYEFVRKAPSSHLLQKNNSIWSYWST